MKKSNRSWIGPRVWRCTKKSQAPMDQKTTGVGDQQKMVNDGNANSHAYSHAYSQAYSHSQRPQSRPQPALQPRLQPRLQRRLSLVYSNTYSRQCSQEKPSSNGPENHWCSRPAPWGSIVSYLFE